MAGNVPELRFHKMHANGDDFLLVDSRDKHNPVTSDLVRYLADRNRGIGFNQLAVLLACDDADAHLLFWNADGSVLNACGSATRGAADLLMNESNATQVTVRTGRGLLTCERTSSGAITVDMGEPLLGWADVPLAEAQDTLALSLAGKPAACSMGNPHCTYFVDDLAHLDVAAQGTVIETHPLFPARPTSTSSRSSTAGISGCASGSAVAVFPSVQAPARAQRQSMESGAACWTAPSRSNAMGVSWRFSGMASARSFSPGR